MNHTKGKWFSHDNGTYIELRSDCPDVELLSWAAIGDVCASKYSEVGDVGVENASRIIDCVNACDGMDSPADEIAKLRSERDELLRVMVEIKADCDEASSYGDKVCVAALEIDRVLELCGGK